MDFIGLIFLLLVLSIGVILRAIGLIERSRKTRKRSGIPEGRVLHVDSRKEELLKFKEPLFSRSLLLTGIPDVVLKRGDFFIPVEIKAREPPERPFKSHLMQLIAYCALLEDAGYRVSHGSLVYIGKKEKEFRIKFDQKEKRRLELLLEEMRKIKSIPPRTEGPRCRICSVREQCEKYG